MPDGSLAREPEMAATFHPCAELFPMMADDEFSWLVADIKANGLRHPIVEVDNAILDGRNRYRACIAAGVPIKTVKFKGPNPLAYVLSANLHRRHLNESQRAMIGAKLANLENGQRAFTSANLQSFTQADAATMLHVSPRSIADAKKVQDKGTPRLVTRVESGEVAVSVAVNLVDLPAEKQDALADADEAILRGASKKERRGKREVDLGDATRAASAKLGSKLYSVIYADPPWSFETYSAETGMDRAADNHYPTMATRDICELKVPAATDAVLFLWATPPMLREAMDVIQAWGFIYKSQFVWIKARAGTGFWTRTKHELLLIATRGHVPAPAPGQQYCSVIETNMQLRHSEKPAEFAEMIEEMFPNLPALEMFARAPRLGWDVWGNETT